MNESKSQIAKSSTDLRNGAVVNTGTIFSNFARYCQQQGQQNVALLQGFVEKGPCEVNKSTCPIRFASGRWKRENQQRLAQTY